MQYAVTFLLATESMRMHVLAADQMTIWLRDNALGHGSQTANVAFCRFDPLETRRNSISFLVPSLASCVVIVQPASGANQQMANCAERKVLLAQLMES
jgi:hypothetical protein